eukprot:TRINITY_DN105678_c0_g1_i1.p1 TRINITY_DN105678_c0_g1~~TRINITY_DN105678_c0_g1_i1.p1  ORF type:complete len:973 (-),score=280.21 TRINITY_DN105678_c0_g1_i1:91-3009(-)
MKENSWWIELRSLPAIDTAIVDVPKPIAVPQKVYRFLPAADFHVLFPGDSQISDVRLKNQLGKAVPENLLPEQLKDRYEKMTEYVEGPPDHWAVFEQFGLDALPIKEWVTAMRQGSGGPRESPSKSRRMSGQVGVQRMLSTMKQMGCQLHEEMSKSVKDSRTDSLKRVAAVSKLSKELGKKQDTFQSKDIVDEEQREELRAVERANDLAALWLESLGVYKEFRETGDGTKALQHYEDAWATAQSKPGADCESCQLPLVFLEDMTVLKLTSLARSVRWEDFWSALGDQDHFESQGGDVQTLQFKSIQAAWDVLPPSRSVFKDMMQEIVVSLRAVDSIDTHQVGSDSDDDPLMSQDSDAGVGILEGVFKGSETKHKLPANLKNDLELLCSFVFAKEFGHSATKVRSVLNQINSSARNDLSGGLVRAFALSACGAGILAQAEDMLKEIEGQAQEQEDLLPMFSSLEAHAEEVRLGNKVKVDVLIAAANRLKKVVYGRNLAMLDEKIKDTVRAIHDYLTRTTEEILDQDAVREADLQNAVTRCREIIGLDQDVFADLTNAAKRLQERIVFRSTVLQYCFGQAAATVQTFELLTKQFSSLQEQSLLTEMDKKLYEEAKLKSGSMRDEILQSLDRCCEQFQPKKPPHPQQQHEQQAEGSEPTDARQEPKLLLFAPIDVESNNLSTHIANEKQQLEGLSLAQCIVSDSLHSLCPDLSTKIFCAQTLFSWQSSFASAALKFLIAVTTPSFDALVIAVTAFQVAQGAEKKYSAAAAALPAPAEPAAVPSTAPALQAALQAIPETAEAGFELMKKLGESLKSLLTAYLDAKTSKLQATYPADWASWHENETSWPPSKELMARVKQDVLKNASIKDNDIKGLALELAAQHQALKGCFSQCFKEEFTDAAEKAAKDALVFMATAGAMLTLLTTSKSKMVDKCKVTAEAIKTNMVYGDFGDEKFHAWDAMPNFWKQPLLPGSTPS